MLTWKNGLIQAVYKGRNNTIDFYFTSKNHGKRHIERTGAKYFESKVLGIDKKNIERDHLL